MHRPMEAGEAQEVGEAEAVPMLRKLRAEAVGELLRWRLDWRSPVLGLVTDVLTVQEARRLRGGAPASERASHPGGFRKRVVATCPKPSLSRVALVQLFLGLPTLFLPWSWGSGVRLSKVTVALGSPAGATTICAIS